MDVWLKKNNDLKFDEDNNSENFIFITCGVSFLNNSNNYITIKLKIS